MNVLDAAINSSPPFILSFEESGPVQSGVSPIPFYAPSLQIEKSMMSYGESSYMATMGQAITIPGGMFNPDIPNSQLSLEIVYSTPSKKEGSGFPLIQTSNYIDVWFDPASSRYAAYVSGVEVANIVGYESPGVDHVALTFSRDTLTLSVNEKLSVASLENPTSRIDNIYVIGSPDAKLHSVVLSREPLDLANMSKTQRAILDDRPIKVVDEPFSGVSFSFSYDNLIPWYEFSANHLNLNGDPRNDIIKEGYINTLGYDIQVDGIKIPAVFIEDVNNIGVSSATSDVTVKMDNGHVFTASSLYRDAMPILALTRTAFNELQSLGMKVKSYSDPKSHPLNLKFALFSGWPVLTSQNAPARVAEVLTGSYIGSEDRPYLRGRANILKDEYLEPEEYPTGYSAWINVSSPGSLFSSSGWNLSTDGLSLSATGLSEVNLNGQEYSGGQIPNGWNFVFFRPSTPTNETIEVGSFSAYNNFVRSFSEYYLPGSHGAGLFERYMEYPKISTSAGAIDFNSDSADVYEHSWAMRSSD